MSDPLRLIRTVYRQNASLPEISAAFLADQAMQARRIAADDPAYHAERERYRASLRTGCTGNSGRVTGRAPGGGRGRLPPTSSPGAQQAAALRRRAANEIDWDNVAEEIEDMGNNAVCAVASHLVLATCTTSRPKRGPIATCRTGAPRPAATATTPARLTRTRWRIGESYGLTGLSSATAPMPETIDGTPPLPVPTTCPVASVDELLTSHERRIRLRPDPRQGGGGPRRRRQAAEHSNRATGSSTRWPHSRSRCNSCRPASTPGTGSRQHDGPAGADRSWSCGCSAPWSRSVARRSVAPLVVPRWRGEWEPGSRRLAGSRSTASSR